MHLWVQMQHLCLVPALVVTTTRVFCCSLAPEVVPELVGEAPGGASSALWHTKVTTAVTVTVPPTMGMLRHATVTLTTVRM